jgi:hypothetical protein
MRWPNSRYYPRILTGETVENINYLSQENQSGVEISAPKT